MAEIKTYEVDISTKQAQENVDELNKSLEAQVDLIDDIEKEIRGYEKQLEKTSKTNLAARKKINDKIKETKERLKDEKVALNDVKKEQQKANQVLKEATDNQAEYSGALSLVDGQLGGVIGKVTGMTQAIGGATKGFNAMRIAIIGTGIGALIIALTSLTAAFTGSEEGQNKFAKIMGVIGVLTGNLVDLFADLGEKIIWVFEEPQQAISDLKDAIKENIQNRIESLIDTFGFLGSAIKKVFQRDFSGAMEDAKKAGSSYIDTMTGVKDTIGKAGKAVKDFTKEQIREANAAAKVADMRAKADKIERNLIVERSKLESEIALLRLKSREEEKYTAEERKQALLDAQKLEDSLLDKETEYLELRRDAQIEENKFSRSNKENLTKEAEAIAAVNRQVAARANTARQVQREVNTISKQIQAQNKAEANRIKAENEAKIKEAATNEENRIKAIRAITEKYKLEDDVTEIEALEIEKGKRLQELEDLEAHWIQKAAIAKFYDDKIKDVKEKNAKTEKELARLELQQGLNDAKATFDMVGKLAGEDSKVGKAMAIASATISGIQGVMNAFSTAQLSPITNVFPAYPYIQAGLAGAVALKNISAIKSVDPSGRGNKGTVPSPSGGGGGATPPIESITPSFNVVGASGTNQLADAIGGQAQTPTRAYVVSSDVTSAQELDRNIVEGASIG